MRSTPARPARGGFSFLEIAGTLIIVAMLMLIGTATFDRLRENTEGVSAGPLLSVAQLEARRLTDADGLFPASVASDLVALSDASLSVTTSASDGSGTVSVYRIDESSMVLASRSGADCLVLLDRLSGSATWALFRGEGEACTASEFAAEAAALDAGGSSSSPQEVAGV